MTRHTNRSTTASPAPHGGLGRRSVKALAALVALTVVIVGVPVLLISLGLAPHALPSVHDVTTSLRSQDSSGLYFVIAGAAAVWIAWLVFTAITVKEIAVSVRLHGPRPSLPHTGLGKLAPAALVATIAVLFVAAPAASTMLGAHASADPAPAAHSTSSVSTIAPAHTVAPITDAPDTAHSHRTGPQRHGSPTYTVQRYDTLWNIAAHHLPGNPADRYRDIARLNSDAIGPDNEITPGTVLRMPADAHGLPTHSTSSNADTSTGTPDTVTVHEGDTLSGLAAEHGVTDWTKVWPANDGRAEPSGHHLQNPNLIRPGWTITLPGSPTTTTPSTPATTAPQTPPKSTVPPAHTTPPATTPAGTPSTTPRTTPTQQTAPSTSTPAQTPASQQPAPSTQTPAHTPAVPASPAATEPADAPTRQVEQAPAAHSSSSTTENTVVAFAGGGVLLAGVSLTALVYRRRRQFQRRRPGRTVSGSPPKLVGMERAVLAAGSAGLADVTWLDAALRSLVQTTAEQPGGTLPDVIAVRLTDVDLTLVLTGAAPNPPAPWRVVGDDATRWSIRREDTLPYDESRRGSYFAPFPTLTSVGYTADGERWMLDLERIAALSLCGDAERCVNLARFLAAELAHNTWSEMLQVTLVGFGAELVEANPDRLTFTENLAAATAAVSSRLSSVTASMGALDTDVLNGRVHDIVGDEWAPNVLLIAPHLAGDTEALDELLAAMKRQHARASVALVLADDPDRADATRWQLTVDAEGNLSIPALGLELIAQQIPAHEAAPLAQMLAYAAVSEDEPIGPAHDDQPWDRYSDACGSLIVSADTDEHDVDSDESNDGVRHDAGTSAAPAAWARGDDAAAVPVLHLAESSPWMRNSVLPLSPQTYLERAATTPEDLSALAPVVNDRIRDEVERADPDLDVDLQAWDDPASPRPKLTLLGTTRVQAQGSLPVSPQVEFHTEIVTLLAGRSRGVPSPEFAETLWPNDPDIVGKSKVRGYARSTRKWLGKDPETGQDYLPSGVYDGRVARYRIDGLLCDAHLFRRLRLRAEARGADGIDDLWRALRLVQGAPFGGIKIAKDEDERPGGWGWFINANHRLDFEYLAMIVDTAHTVADYHLGAGEPERAAEAAQVALRGGAYDDVPLLDLVAACLAQEQQAEAESYVQQLLSNAGVEREADLEPRTAEVLSRLRRRWHDRAS